MIPEFIKSLEKQFGFDKPAYERFFLMLWNYLRFDFGKSYFRDVSVLQLIKEKLPVSISLGIWMTLLSYLISIPLGIRKAVRDGSQFDVWTSGVIIVGYAIPGFLFAILLIILFAGGSFFDIFPLRGLTSDGWSQFPWWQKILDYFWHLTLPIISMGLAAFATMTLLTKNSFLEELRKQYVLTARAKGCSERQVLYGHIFRNAMLLVVAGFPGAFVSAFFAGSLLDRDHLLARRARTAQLRERAQPRLSGRVRQPLHLRAGRAGREPDFRPHLHLDRSAHRFRDAGGLSWTSRPAPTKPSSRRRRRIAPPLRLTPDVEPTGPLGLSPPPRRFALSPINQRRWHNFKTNRRGYCSLWIFLVLFVDLAVCRIHRQRQAALSSATRANRIFPSSSPTRKPTFGGDFETAADYRDPVCAEADCRQGRQHDLAADPIFLRHPQSRFADAGAVASRPGC